MDPSTHAIEAWRHEVGRKLLSLDFAPVGDTPFAIDLDVPFAAGRLRLARFSHSPGFTFRDKSLVAAAPDDAFTLVLARGSALRAGQYGREVEVPRAGGTVLDNDAAGFLGEKHNVTFQSLCVPRSDLEAFGIDLSKLVVRPISGANASLRLLRSYVRLIEKERDQLTAEATEAARRHIVELAALTLREAEARSFATNSDAKQAGRLAATLADIEASLSDPLLSVAIVAARQHISPRYLHMILERAGIRFSEHVAALRLEKVYRELENAASDEVPITALALAAGFGDISHFNRLFRERFGCPPSAVRKRRTRLM